MRVYRFDEWKTNEAALSKLKGDLPRIDESFKFSNYLSMNEGGAYGHLMHPFDNRTLSFGDLQEMIEISISGAFNPENFVQEKTDGQNLLFTWKDGGLRAARNGGHIKNFGEKSLNKSEISQMFDGRGEIQIAFTAAVEDLESAISQLSADKLEKIFGNGKKFMSVEVIYPKTQNVIPYGLSMLVFHGTNEYDESGKEIGQFKEEAKLLADLIKEANQEVQKTFFIRGPLDLKLEALPDTSKKQAKYKAILQKIMKSQNMTPANTITEYLDSWWTEFITANAPGEVKPEFLAGLITRWARADKGGYKITAMKADADAEQLAWVKEFEKNKDLQLQVKKAIMPLEHLFLNLGADILTNVTQFLAAIPKDATETMRKEIERAITTIKSADSLANIQKLEKELVRIEASGGLKRLVPTEGITFIFKGKLYKYTGLFAAVNQLAGILRYI
jgi:hypothetical protein